MPKTPKRPRDMMELAKFIGNIAAHQAEEPVTPTIDPKASARGAARASKLSPARRRQIAQGAAKARWKRKG